MIACYALFVTALRRLLRITGRDPRGGGGLLVEWFDRSLYSLNVQIGQDPVAPGIRR